MKKLKLFFACLLMAVLSIGQVWGDSYTITLKNGTGSSDSSSGIQGSTTISDFVADGASYVSAVAGSGKVYQGASGYGLKFGNSSGGGSITLTLAASVKPTSIVVSASQYGATEGTGVFQGTNYDMTGGGGKGNFNNYTVEYDGNTEVTTISVGCTKRGYVKSITVNYGTTPSPSCTSEITITKADDPANGTFALDNSGTVCIDEGNATVNVTATPAAHYHLASVTSTAGTIGSIAGNTCEITDIDADTEIGVTFAEDTKYVVTWNVNGNEDTKTNVYAGEKPVFPATPAACDATSTTFIGWATAPWTGKLADLSEKTVYTSASAMPDVDAAVTYYAVFAKSSGSASELFSWAGGGKEALLAIEGIVSSSLDADYAASHSPYQVKWNGNGKYLIIPVSAQPGKLSVGFKMIGGATTSTVDVQESTATDGEFTNVETLTISGASNDVVNLETTNAFKSTTRAIKLLYHKGSNVGLGPISIEGAVSMSDYMTTCCTKYNVNIAAGITNGSVSADPASACEGATVTLTFTPAGGYHLDSWSLNGTAQDVNENTFSMPAAAATVSATFAHDDCANLAAPTLGEITKTYNSATIAWNEVTDAEEYAVSVVNHATSESVFAGNVDALSKALADLEPETQYDYSIMAVGDGTIKCADGNGVLAGNFTTEPLPTAHLTLIDPSGTHASSGDYAILTPFNLPTTAAACSKEFRGWDSDENCATAPTYAKGAEFTFANTTGVTLYAVYADELTPGTTSYVKTALADIASGSEVVVTELYSETIYAIGNDGGTSTGPAAVELAESATDVLNVGDNTNIFWVLTKDGANFSLTIKGGTDKLYCTDTNNGVRVGTNENNVFSISSDYIFNNATSRYVGYNHGNGGLFRCYTTINTNINGETLAFYKKTVGEGTYGNYSTACVASPTATPASASIEVAATGGSSTLGVTYENVNLAAVAVALYNNEACTEDFDGGWLTASIAGDDKHIAYTATENTSYNDARTAYIKLTAPETSAAADPAVVVIPVEQAKKAAVFGNLAELVAANVNSGIQVTVTFEEVITNDQTISGPKRAGLFLTTTAGSNSKAIEIFYNKGTTAVPAEWVIGGKLAATSMTFTWTLFNSDQWELVPLGNDWTWDNGDLTYTAPKAVSSVVVSGSPTKTSYVDGEKFAPAGLTVTVNYTEGEPEVNPVGVTFTCTPERVAKSDDPVSVNVVATFNEVDSDPFEVTGLTVGDIQTKTVEQFIAAGNADMRCYLEGIVSDIETGSKLKYGNFNLTDASGTIYVYGCLNQDGEAEQFADLGVANGDKIKVIAEDYEFYNSKHEAKNVQFVSKTSPVAITITSASTVEKGKTLTLTATTDPAEAVDHISYSVKIDGNEDNVSLSGNVLTGVEVGEATIIASIPDGEGYIANSLEFTVEVTAAIVHGSITYVENGANEDIDDVADATALPDPLPTVTKDGFLFGGWWTTSTFEDGTEAVAGASLTGDVILYAKWNAIPPYALVYTSNVAFVGGGDYYESGSKVSINSVQYDAQKVGSSSNSGTITVTVPAYTHTLHFHVFTWNNQTITLNVTSDDVTNLSASELAVDGDPAGSGSKTYTISSNPVNHYQYITFDPIATEAQITFSRKEGDKRFIMYGINQEGGVLPVLDHIVITGNASATEYEAGDVFSPVGLGVDAYYTLNDEPVAEPTHLDIDENWSGWSVSPAILTGETTSVTVTATYEGKSANKSVDVNVSAPATPEILASPASINFGTVNQNAAVDAQGISVTLKAVAAATVTLDGAGFTIDKAALSELNSTVTVTPVTTATGTFAATVTISDDADAADDVVINLSMTVEAVEDLSGTWVKATSVAAGDRIIIGATYQGATKTMGGQNTNNRAAVASELDGDVLTPAEGTKTFLVVDAGDGKFALQALNGNYLTSATSGTGNNLWEAANYENDNAKWTITIDGEGVASVVAAAGSKTDMQYNNSNNIFSCYASGNQKPINIYKKGAAPEPTPDYTRPGLTVGNYATICLPNGGNISGATLFDLDYYDGANTLYLLEVNGNAMVAGRPYIFLPSVATIEVFYTDEENAPAGTYRGLIGSYSKQLITPNEENYILLNNQYWYVNSEAYVGDHRAYIDMNLVADEPMQQQAGAPRRRVAMAVNGENAAQGIEDVQGDNVQSTKVLINGNLYILRGEKVYDATGRLVK